MTEENQNVEELLDTEELLDDLARAEHRIDKLTTLVDVLTKMVKDREDQILDLEIIVACSVRPWDHFMFTDRGMGVITEATSKLNDNAALLQNLSVSGGEETFCKYSPLFKDTAPERYTKGLSR